MSEVQGEKRLGQRIRDLRVNKELTMKELADAIGCTKSFIAQAESGERKLSVVRVKQIAAALGVPAKRLLVFAKELPFKELERRAEWDEYFVPLLHELIKTRKKSQTIINFVRSDYSIKKYDHELSEEKE